METGLQVVEERAPLTISEMKQHLNLIQDAMREVMKEGEDYGIIPGTPKPTLLKPGAEKLNLLFRLDPEYEITESYEPTQDGPKHYTVVSKCTLFHSPTGRRLGSGYGSCSTKEKKYAMREAKRKCPHATCGKPTIFKSKDGGWFCWAKMGGCGATFKDGDERIEKQETGFVLNPDLADQYNTILKMANKRSLVAASLNVTGASAIFTQDVEDMVPYQDNKPKEGPKDAKPAQANKPVDAQIIPNMKTYVWATDVQDGKVFQMAEEYGGSVMDWIKEHLGWAKDTKEVEALQYVAKNTLDEAGYKSLDEHFRLQWKALKAKEKKAS